MLSDDELPRLPYPRWLGGDIKEAFSADQMHDYARAVERAAYERAAQECKRRWKGGYPQEVVDDCAAAIRALGRQHEHQ